MNWTDIDRNPTPRKLRQFAVIWFAVFAGSAAWLWFGQGWTAITTALVAIGVVGGAAGLLFPATIRPLFVGLTIATFPFGWVVSRLILAIVFYGVVTPIGLLLRLAGRDPLALRTKKKPSYWTETDNSTRMPASYLREF